MRLSSFLIILILFSPGLGHALFTTGIGGAVVQENKNISLQKTSTKNFYEVYALSQLQKWPVHVGLAYMIVSSSNELTETTNEQLSSANLYVMARFGFFKNEPLSLTIYFNPTVQATYATTGNVADKWTGAAYAVQVLAQPKITETFRLNGGVMYHTETYSTKSSTSASSSASSFTRTSLLPVLGMQYSF